MVKGVGEQAAHGDARLLAHQQHRAVDDHAIASGQTTRHHDRVGVARAQRDVTPLELTAGMSTKTVVRRSSWTSAPTGTVTTVGRAPHSAPERTSAEQNRRGVLELGDHFLRFAFRDRGTGDARDAALERLVRERRDRDRGPAALSAHGPESRFRDRRHHPDS